MRVTTREMRKSVRKWLAVENATVLHALALQSAIEAGAIAGTSYGGKRSTGEVGNIFISEVDRFQYQTNSTPEFETDPKGRCGCLLGTMERIKHSRPVKVIRADGSAETFALATMLGMGDTPKNSKWARAAVKGIEDYVATVER